MYKLLYVNHLISLSAKLSLILVAISNTALYISLPILPTYIVQYRQMDGAIVGIIISFTLFTSSIFSVLTGPLSDKFGHKVIIVWGFIFRSIGFFGISITDNMYSLILLSLVNGIGSACSRPAISSILASTNPKVRPMVFILYNQMLNIGVIIGPIIGTCGLLYLNPKYCFLISSILFAVGAALTHRLLLAPFIVEKSYVKITLVSRIKSVLLDKRFTIYCLTVFFGWFLISQLNITWSFKAVEKGNSLIWANILIFLNGLIGIITTHIIYRKYLRLQTLKLIFLGFLGMIIALIIVAIANKTLFYLLICLTLYTIAESFLLQGLELQVSEYITPQTSASYYGIFNLVAGISGIIGSYFGGYMISSCVQDSTMWYSLSIIGTFGLMLVWLQFTEQKS